MSETITAAVLTKLGAPLEIEELQVPQLQAGQVLVRIAYAGICHTQLSEVRGRRGPDNFLPHCLGHEGSGTVISIGAEVTKVKPGDNVAMTWLKGSGKNVGGAIYQSSRLGKVNAGAITTFMTAAVTSENRLFVLPPAFDLEIAALLGCAVPTGAGAVKRTAAAKAGESIAVFGVGGVGLVAIMAAKLLGGQPIIAVDIIDHKLEAAKRFGATHVINASRDDPVTAIKKISGPGVDIAVEASGNARAMEQAYASVRPGGGRAILAGNAPSGQMISIDPFSLILGRNIKGSWGGDTIVDEDLMAYANAYTSGQMDLGSLITHRFSLHQVNDAIDAIESGKVLRAMIDLTKG